MIDNSMMTQYSTTEIVRKNDPRIARRGKLDSLLAEAWLVWKQARECDSHNYERINILLEIQHTLWECVRVESVVADPNCHQPVWIDVTAWYGDMRIQCARLAQEHFGDLPNSIIGAKINVLRTHIREAELLFSYEGATEIDKSIQWRLNALSAAAYVAMWAKDRDRGQELTLLEEYTLEDLTDELRVIQATSLVDFESVMSAITRLAGISRPYILDNYRVGALQIVFDNIQEMVDGAKAIVGSLEDQDPPDAIREKWFEDNFTLVNLADVVEDLPEWEEQPLTQDYPQRPIPRYIWECIAKDASTLREFFLANNGPEVEEIARERGLRVFLSSSRDYWGTLYIGSNKDEGYWLYDLYDAVYAPGKKHC